MHDYMVKKIMFITNFVASTVVRVDIFANIYIVIICLVNAEKDRINIVQKASGNVKKLH